MVSARCKILVMEELNKLGLLYTDLELGSVVLTRAPSPEQMQLLGRRLSESGLELQEDKKGILVEKVKRLINGLLDTDHPRHEKYSAYLTDTLHYDYNYLSNIFTEIEGQSIQNYIIQHKIELVKRLLLAGDLNLTEIAYRLNYSSSAHLSNQFKKITGLSPSFFKNSKARMKHSKQ
jgi:AraC-like DNA-binding protein